MVRPLTPLCRLTVADIRGLGDNRSCLSMFTNDKGTIIDDTMITKNPDHLYVVVNAGCADKDLLHLNTQLAKWKKNGKDVTMTRQAGTVNVWVFLSRVDARATPACGTSARWWRCKAPRRPPCWPRPLTAATAPRL